MGVALPKNSEARHWACAAGGLPNVYYGRNYVDRLISAAEVFQHLGTNSSLKPEHETQLRPLVGLSLDQAQMADLGDAAKGKPITGDGMRVLAAYAQGYHPILWSQATGKMEITNSLAPTFRSPSAAVLSKDGSTIVGNPFYYVSDKESYGSRAGRWTEATGWEQLSPTDGTPVAVSQNGTRALFTFPSGPRVLFIWTRATGFVESTIPNYVSALMTSDGEWIVSAQPVATSVWRV